MSRECKIRLEITGPFESILKFKKEAMLEETLDDNGAKMTRFSLDALYPCPLTEFEGQEDWCKENWGTSKLFPFIVGYECNDSVLCFEYFTVATPPMSAFEKISKDYPDLLFDSFCWCIGSGFCGNFCYQDGDLVEYGLFEDDTCYATFDEDEESDDMLVLDDLSGTNLGHIDPNCSCCCVYA